MPPMCATSSNLQSGIQKRLMGCAGFKMVCKCKFTRYGGGHTAYGCVTPKRNWNKWMVMNERRVIPEIARFSFPVEIAMLREISYVRFKATHTCSNAQIATYSSTMLASRPNPDPYKRT